LREWLKSNQTCPICKTFLNKDVISNISLKSLVPHLIKLDQSFKHSVQENQISQSIIESQNKKIHFLLGFIEKIRKQIEKYEQIDKIAEDSNKKEKLELNNYKIIDPKEIFFCSRCKKILESPFSCEYSCGKYFCKRCLNGENCPECKNEIPIFNEKRNQLIDRIRVQCLICEKEISYSQYDQHYQENHQKSSCKYSSSGCGFQDSKEMISIHQKDCHFKMKFESEEYHKILFSLSESFKEIPKNTFIPQIESIKKEIIKKKEEEWVK
jgi:hypothetical protein